MHLVMLYDCISACVYSNDMHVHNQLYTSSTWPLPQQQDIMHINEVHAAAIVYMYMHVCQIGPSVSLVLNLIELK